MNSHLFLEEEPRNNQSIRHIGRSESGRILSGQSVGHEETSNISEGGVQGCICKKTRVEILLVVAENSPFKQGRGGFIPENKPHERFAMFAEGQAAATVHKAGALC